MHKTSFLPLVAAVAILLVSGCVHREHSDASANLARTGPKSTHQTDAAWYAQCKGHSPVWKGSLRREKEWAIRDAAAHEKEHPGHKATIER